MELDTKKLTDWIDLILTEDGVNLSFESIRTLGFIKKEIQNHECELPESIKEALNSGDGVYRP